jgi:hypothetical protein
MRYWYFNTTNAIVKLHKRESDMKDKVEILIFVLTIKAENDHNLTLDLPMDLRLKYRETGRNSWTTTHYPTLEQFFIGLINLVDTGHASLPAQS